MELCFTQALGAVNSDGFNGVETQRSQQPVVCPASQLCIGCLRRTLADEACDLPLTLKRRRPDWSAERDAIAARWHRSITASLRPFG